MTLKSATSEWVRYEAKNSASKHWTCIDDPQSSSEGKALRCGVDGETFYNGDETTRVSVGLSQEGRYTVWVRYRAVAEKAVGFTLAIRDDQALVIGAETFRDRSVFAPSKVSEAPLKLKENGYRWGRMSLELNRPMNVQISFIPVTTGSEGKGAFATIDCLLFTKNGEESPAQKEMRWVQSIPLAKLNEMGEPVALTELQSSLGYPYHPGFFSGTEAMEKGRFPLALINCFSTYLDLTRSFHLGFNSDHITELWKKEQTYGMESIFDICMYPEQEGAIQHDWGQKGLGVDGKFKNIKGEQGATWSLAYPPLIEAMKKECAQKVAAHQGEESIRKWVINGEQGGFLDTSIYSLQAFRKWAQKKHGSLQVANQKWGTHYKGWEEIIPPSAAKENFGVWADFYEFSSDQFIESVKIRREVVHQNDPQKRPVIGQIANADLLMPYFAAIRPLDVEKYFAVALEGEPFVGCDLYCTDDVLGTEVELLKSFSRGRPLCIYEWNTHTPDPRIAARSMWVEVCKGVKGIDLFHAQESMGAYDAGLKWSIYKRDGTPKEKLGAFADVSHEVNRLSRFLMRAKEVNPVKPVAIYYSKLDLAMDKPFESMWSCGLNNPYRVYSVLRAAGYQVTWMTPESVIRGGLKEVSAVVFVNANYIPEKAAVAIERWVEKGGVVIGDGFPGMFNEYGRNQTVMAKVFGVKAPPVEKEKVKKMMEESTQGYGEVTMAVIDYSDIAATMGEITNHWTSEHPILKEVGDFHLSGKGNRVVEQVSGEMIGVGYNQKPGLVVNRYGKGISLYSAVMLGTLFDAECSTPAFNETNTGTSYVRLMKSFLKYSGIEPCYQFVGLREKEAAFIRVERPLVDPQGNAMIGVTSLFPSVIKEFELEYQLSSEWKFFKKIYWIEGGSRSIREIESRVVGNQLKVKIPSFDTHGALLLMKEYGPLVSVELPGIERGVAGLHEIRLQQQFEVVFKIWNASSQAITEGELEVFTPRGWHQSVTACKVQKIEPWAYGEFKIKVQAPRYNGIRDAKPITGRFKNKKMLAIGSEVVWLSNGK